MTKAIYRKKTCCHNLLIIITIVMMMIFFHIYIPTAPSPPLPASNLFPPTSLLLPNPFLLSAFPQKRAVLPRTSTKHCITNCKKTTGIYHHISAGRDSPVGDK